MSDPLPLPRDWRFPGDVPGWLTEPEGRKLAELAAGRVVLEIGSYCGRSTVCMAQTAARVHAVDPHDGRGTPTPTTNTLVAFHANLVRYGVEGRVATYVTTSAQARLDEPSGAVDVAFIDGAHDYESVAADVAVARRWLRPGGLLAFHDYRTRPGEHDGGWDPGVTRAVDELIERGEATLLARAGSVAVLRVRAAPERRDAVFLCCPAAGARIDGEAGLAFFHASKKRTVHCRPPRGSSLLATNCNVLWCEALNLRERLGLRWFAMLHSDVAPEVDASAADEAGRRQPWLDELIDTAERHGADFLSAVVAIKDVRGVTSTALQDPAQPWTPFCRLTLQQLNHETFPQTFDATDAAAALQSLELPEDLRVKGMPDAPVLLANTGCMVVRVDRPWAPNVWFEMLDTINYAGDGQFRAWVQSEDWVFSRKVHQVGGRVMCTKRVRAVHKGPNVYHSAGTWGQPRDFDCEQRRHLAPAR